MSASDTRLVHTDREFAGELRQLREEVLMMGARVEDAVGASIRALSERDVELARQVLADDRQIDQLESDIDEQCLCVLARRHPVASDLRFITTTLKLVTDLERIGDLCVSMCERTIELQELPRLSLTLSLPELGELVQRMLHDSLDAFVDGDAQKARQVINRDTQVDAGYARIFQELVALMQSDSELVYAATRVQSIGKYLERMADHTTNICEMVIFMVEGRDVRHPATAS